MFALLFFIAALLVYFNLIQSEGDAVNQLRSQVASKTALLDGQKQVVGQVQNLIQQFQNVGRLRDTVSIAMPNGEQNIGAVRQIEAIAGVSNVTLSSIEFKVAVSKTVKKADPNAPDLLKKLGTLNITLTATGAYEDLKRFLSDLETSVRVMNVKEFKFVPGVGQNGGDRINLTIETYFQQ